MHFFVKIITKEGKTGYTLVASPDFASLDRKLKADGVVPLNITPLPAFISKILPDFRKKVKPDEVVEILESLHLIIKSGIPLYDGLKDFAKESDNKSTRAMLYDIADSINRGNSLSHAFEPYKKIVGPVILNLIKIGEDTGQLETTLKRAAEFTSRVIALKKKAKGALIYPAFSFVAVFGAMLVWMIYVLPQLLGLFKSMGVKLPPLTKAIIAVSDFLSAYILYIIAAIIIFIIIFRIAHKRYKKVRLFTDKVVLKIPIIKEIVKGFNIAFITQYLRLALVSGVPIFNALKSLTTNLTNEVFKDALESSTKLVSQGHQISTSFAKTGVFSPFTTRMINVGESAGSLDAQLNIISDHYYERVNYFAENISKVIEPVVMIMVGGFMAIVVAGLMGPLYDLISHVQ